MKTRMKHTATEIASREINDAKRLADILKFKLQELMGKQNENPKSWGPASEAAHIRARLEEMLFAFYPVGDGDEETAREYVRKQAGIQVNRDWD